MSWALSLRGGYLTAPMWEPTGSLNDWEVVLNVKRVSGSNNAVIFSISDYTDGIYINAANTTGQDAISLHVGGRSVSLSNTGFHSYNDYHRVIAKCVSGSISLEVDGVVSNATPRGALYFNTKKFIIGANKSGLYSIDIDIKDISVFDINDVSSYRKYNADESFHGVTTPDPLRLVNTLDPSGSTDAIGGVNMPTDGSAWVDLGGGGISVTDTSNDSNSTSLFDSVLLVAPFNINDDANNTSSLSNSDSIKFLSAVIISDSASNSESLSSKDNVILIGSFNVLDNSENSTSISNNDSVSFSSSIRINDGLNNSDSVSNLDDISFIGQFIIADANNNTESLSTTDVIIFSGAANITDTSNNTQSSSLFDSIQIGQFKFNVKQKTNINGAYLSKNINGVYYSTNING